MASDSSKSAAARSSTYEKLVANYRAAAAQCQASLDQLVTAERELRAFAASIDGETHSDLLREIDSTLGTLCERRVRVPILSKRELEVFELIGDGLTTQEIAARLSIAISTVETYRERLKQKFDVDSGNALNRQAILWVASRDKASRSDTGDGHA